MSSDALTRAFAKADRMRASAKQTSSQAGAMLTGGRGMPFHKPTLSVAAEQYEHHKNWSYVAIKAIAQRIAGQDLFVGRPRGQTRLARKTLGENVEPLDSHPLLDAFMRPNPLMTKWPLVVFVLSGLELTGRAYLWAFQERDEVELWPLPSSWVEPLDNMRSGWRIRPPGEPEGFEVPGESIAPMVLPDPSDPFSSLSPLQTQADAVLTDEAIQQSQHRAMENGIFPQMMVKAGKLPGVHGEEGERPILEPEQRRELVDSIKQVFQGAVNYNEPLIVDGLIESAERLTSTPQELDFNESSRTVKSRILQAYGVNPLAIGEVQDGNRAQAAVAEQAFCNAALNPVIQLISEALTVWASRFFGEPLAVWIEPCTANDPELNLRRWESAARLGFVTREEFRRHQLNLPDQPEGTLIDPVTGEERQSSTVHKHRQNGHAGRRTPI